MQQADSAGMSIHQLHGIQAGLRDPVAIHFQPDQFGIGACQQRAKAIRIAELLELVVVVVESEAHSTLADFCTPAIELIRSLLETLERGPHRLWQHWAYQVTDSEFLSIIKLCVESVVVEVAAWR